MLNALIFLVTLSIPALPTALAMVACPISIEAGAAVRARPPPQAIAAVWPLLFLGLGLALHRLRCKWPVLLLALLLGLWPLLYSNRCGGVPRAACWTLMLCIGSALVAVSFAVLEGDKLSIAALSALLAWLVFVQLLAVLEVQFATYEGYVAAEHQHDAGV